MCSNATLSVTTPFCTNSAHPQTSTTPAAIRSDSLQLWLFSFITEMFFITAASALPSVQQIKLLTVTSCPCISAPAIRRFTGQSLVLQQLSDSSDWWSIDWRFHCAFTLPKLNSLQFASLQRDLLVRKDLSLQPPARLNYLSTDIKSQVVLMAAMQRFGKHYSGNTATNTYTNFWVHGWTWTDPNT